jgi:hypothetical protein
MTERTIERLHKKEAKDISEFEPFSIKVTVESIGVEVIINTKDPLDCVVMAGRIIDALQKLGKEPKVVILP